VIERVFDRLRSRDEAALVAYLMGGYPTLERSLDLAEATALAGADLLEIGIPWSDPIADGPTIERAGHAALAGGTRLRHVLEALETRALGVPSLVMSYLNPLLALGLAHVVERLARAGVAGVIVPDLPLDEARPFRMALEREGLCLIPLVAPTTEARHLARLAELDCGFVYCVSVTGTTGARVALPAELPDQLRRVRAATRLPVVAGFGISTPEQVRDVCAHCDGVVVGSRLVQAIEDGEDPGEHVRSLKAATRR